MRLDCDVMSSCQFGDADDDVANHCRDIQNSQWSPVRRIFKVQDAAPNYFARCGYGIRCSKTIQRAAVFRRRARLIHQLRLPILSAKNFNSRSPAMYYNYRSSLRFRLSNGDCQACVMLATNVGGASSRPISKRIHNAVLPNIHVSDHGVYMKVDDTLQKINKQRDRIATCSKKASDSPTYSRRNSTSGTPCMSCQ